MRIAAAKSLNKMGMSQSEIAKRLGVAQAAVSKYLSNRYSVKIARIERLIEAKGLHKSVIGLVMAKGDRRAVLRKIDQIASSSYMLRSTAKIVK